MKTLEALNCFESSVQLLVHALDQVRRSRAIDVEDCFCLYIGSQLLAALEDVVHRGYLHGIILMAGRAPAYASFQTIFAQVLNLEDVLLDIRKE